MKTICWVVLMASSALASDTWYVRTDGGNRSQCDGRTNEAYPGSGTNQPCALKHPFYLFTTDPPASAGLDIPKWIFAGGDTVIIANGEYRIGYKTNDVNGWWNYRGCRGDPNGCYNPVIPAGSAEEPTRILGESWSSGCQDKPKFMGGLAVNAVLNLRGAQNVEINCLEISDYAQCGTGNLGPDNCKRSGFPISDYALRGVQWDVDANNLALRNMNIHGLSNMGIRGRIGGAITVENVRIAGIQGGGWDNDEGGNVHSTGSLTVRNLLIEWCGCLEEYPLRSRQPYYKCFDQTHGGYGDGFGLLIGQGMKVDIDRSTFRNNVQDGVDFLYVQGKEHDVRVTRSQSYANGGQQWKFGQAQSISFTNNLTVSNCRRFAEPVPGAPETFNQNFTDFCRAFDGVIAVLGPQSIVDWKYNTFVGYNSVLFDIQCQTVDEFFDTNGRTGVIPEPAQTPDGVRRTFELSYTPNGMDTTPAISIQRQGQAKQTQTIGILGRDTGRNWYWSTTSRSITQDQSAAPLAAGDILTVRYRGDGYCSSAKINFQNNAVRGYVRKDTGRTPTAFYFVGMDGTNFFDASTRRQNLYCGVRQMPLFSSESFSAECPGNWLLNEVNFENEAEMDRMDLRPLPGGPLIDKAEPVPEISDDHDGIARPFGAGPDIGAYELAPLDSSLRAQRPVARAMENGVEIGWQATPGATSYRLQRRPMEGAYEADLGQTRDLSYIDSSVEATQTYCYRIRVENGLGAGGWSEDACTTAPAQFVPLARRPELPPRRPARPPRNEGKNRVDLAPPQPQR